MMKTNFRPRQAFMCVLFSVFAVIATLLIAWAASPARIAKSEIKVYGGWQTPQPVPVPISSPEWEDGPSISPDGTKLYFTRGRDRDVKTYVSENVAGVWSQPTPLDINLDSFPTGAPHTQDNKTLYFASVRPGGYGESDIYSSTCVNGRWKNVTNLGESINTRATESEPFISSNGRVLYFASTRPGGKGKVDIWMAEKTNDGWSRPVNLGSPVNSDCEETQPFVTQDERFLYFTAVNRYGVPGPAVFRSLRQGQKWGPVEIVISGFVGEPTLTSDQETLYFVHLLRKKGKLMDAEIMSTRRTSR